MVNLPDIFSVESSNNDTPLPLIVAKRWNFPLAHVRTDEGIFYAIQDWMRGILETNMRKVTKILTTMRRRRVEINEAIHMLPYTSTDNKTYRRPYTNEPGLMNILVNSRLAMGRGRLAEVRNFIAQSMPGYEYLICSPVADKQLTEYDFQSTLVNALEQVIKFCAIKEYYPTPSGRKIDIALFREQQTSILIECKVSSEEFYKAIGQLICYKADLSEEVFDTSDTRLAIAMPPEYIDDDMRRIARRIGLSLISIVDGLLIDAITGQPIRAEAW